MSAKGKVFISKDAYLTIAASCYRYANPTIVKNQWAEVQGALYGYNNGDDVHVMNAVPLTHLSEIEVRMHEADYVALAVKEEEMAAQNWFQVGWFHSHPGIELLLSLEDVKTQAGLQAPNPLSVALVFNHVLLMDEKENVGFEIYRLDDPSTIEIRYHELPYEFSDSGERLIEEARQLLFNVQRFLSGEVSVMKIFSKIKKDIKKINSEIYGLKDYISTLARQTSRDEVAQSFIKHKNRIRKLVEKRGSSIEIQLDLLKYLELKEAVKYQPDIEAKAKEWSDFLSLIPGKMEEIEKSLSSQKKE